MNKNQKMVLAFLLILFSPLIGGILGKVIVALGILQFSHVLLEEILVYFEIIACLVAAVLYYLHVKDQ